MKKAILWALFPLLSLAFINGCAQGPAPAQPQGPDIQAKGIDEAEQAEGQSLSAPYYYMLSRRHLNKGDAAQAEKFLDLSIKKDPGSSFLKREMVRLLQQQKKNDQALEMAEQLAEQAPGNVDNLLLLARMKKDGGDELTELFKKILELAPDNRETYLHLGKIYMDGEQPEEALELFTRMADTFPDYYVAHFYLGEARLLTGSPDKAELSFKKTLELEPELVEPRFRLIDIYRSEKPDKNKKKILDQYTEILKMEPGNDRALLELALFHHKNRDSKKADALFARLGEELKDNSRLAMSAVDAFISRKRYEDAVIVFTRLLEASPANTGLNFFLAMSHEALEHREKAIAFYLKVPPEHPQYKKAMLSIAFLHRDQGRMGEAVKFLEHQHSQSPADIDILSYLASFYDEEKRYDEAMTLLQTGLKQSPENTALMFKLGATQDKAGLREDCIKTMKALLRTDPDHSGALNYLGYTYAEMGVLLDEALELIQRALQIKPGDGYITDSLGWVYYKKGDFGKAVTHLEKAAEISEYEAIIADHLADAYMKNGQPQKAAAMYKKALANAQDTQEDLVKAIKAKLKALEPGNDKK